VAEGSVLSPVPKYTQMFPDESVVVEADIYMARLMPANTFIDVQTDIIIFIMITSIIKFFLLNINPPP
jgi:hypothetical protein